MRNWFLHGDTWSWNCDWHKKQQFDHTMLQISNLRLWKSFYGGFVNHVYSKFHSRDSSHSGNIPNRNFSEWVRVVPPMPEWLNAKSHLGFMQWYFFVSQGIEIRKPPKCLEKDFMPYLKLVRIILETWFVSTRYEKYILYDNDVIICRHDFIVNFFDVIFLLSS